MGKVKETYYDKLISDTSDRNSNRIRVYRKMDDEVVIHFRNLKITLFRDDIAEWKEGFTQALKELQDKDYFRNDL